MKKIISYITIIAVLLIGVVSVANSYMGHGFGNYNNQLIVDRYDYEQNLEIQNQMHEIMTNGTYEDIIDFRKENNLPMPRRNYNQENFNIIKENVYGPQNGFNGGCHRFQRGGFGMRGNFYN